MLCRQRRTKVTLSRFGAVLLLSRTGLSVLAFTARRYREAVEQIMLAAALKDESPAIKCMDALPHCTYRCLLSDVRSNAVIAFAVQLEKVLREKEREAPAHSTRRLYEEAVELGVLNHVDQRPFGLFEPDLEAKPLWLGAHTQAMPQQCDDTTAFAWTQRFTNHWKEIRAEFNQLKENKRVEFRER